MISHLLIISRAIIYPILPMPFDFENSNFVFSLIVYLNVNIVKCYVIMPRNNKFFISKQQLNWPVPSFQEFYVNCKNKVELHKLSWKWKRLYQVKKSFFYLMDWATLICKQFYDCIIRKIVSLLDLYTKVRILQYFIHSITQGLTFLQEQLAYKKLNLSDCFIYRYLIATINF